MNVDDLFDWFWETTLLSFQMCFLQNKLLDSCQTQPWQFASMVTFFLLHPLNHASLCVCQVQPRSVFLFLGSVVRSFILSRFNTRNSKGLFFLENVKELDLNLALACPRCFCVALATFCR